MFLPAESFDLYVERRRQEAIGAARQRRRWMFLTCLLAVYLWPFHLLGLLALPAGVSVVPVTSIGIALYLAGTYLLTVARDRWFDPRQWRSFISQSFSVPHLAIAAAIWLSVGVWGDTLAPLLSRQIPQVMAGVVLSAIVTGGHYFFTFQTWWSGEMSQLWGDYLNEVRSALLPYYSQLERARQSYSEFGTLCDDLMLEEVEMHHLSEQFGDRVALTSTDWTGYADRLTSSRQHLSQLLHQLETGIDILEAALFEMESHLDWQRGAANVGDAIAPLSPALMQPVFELSRDLVAVERTLEGVTERMDRFASADWHHLA